MTRPLLLDLFCGAGGAAAGYVAAGFDVIGIDIAPMPRYPWEFIQADAMDVLDELEMSGCWLLPPGQRQRRRCIDAGELAGIHASPPCQGYSVMSQCRPGLATEYPKLIEPVRKRLHAASLPCVIENVPGSPLRNPVWLCGCQFGLTADWPGKGRVGLRRKRGFEASFLIPPLNGHDHSLRSIPVYGHNAPGNRPDLCGPGFARAAREAMCINWMTREELAEAIPPAYTEYIGRYLMAHIRGKAGYVLAA